MPQHLSLSPSLFGKEVEEAREWEMMDSNKEVNKEGKREFQQTAALLQE